MNDAETETALITPAAPGPAAVAAAGVVLSAVGRDVAPAPAAGPPRPERFVSLDVFRGVTIAGMLLVNNPGTWSSIHPPLEHAEWHGWTPTDLIFPFFLFIVGVAMTFSFGKLLDAGVGRGALMGKVVKRAAILFALGLLLHAFPNYLDLSGLRIPGVLQRIAFAYLAASVVVLFTGLRAQIAITAGLLIGYWALETLVPIPGVGAGALEPGRDLSAWLDRLIFGEAHLWTQTTTWDPEGLLSTIPAVATALTGVFAGYWLRSARSPADRLVGLFLAGNAGLLLGLIWGAWFPINKNLWTSSYVLFTAGMACHFLAVCYWLVDVRGYRRWSKPFVIFGMNAIAAFFLSSLLARIITLVRVPAGAETVPLKAFVFERAFAPYFADPANASLAFALGYVLLWLGLMTVLYKRRIFIKV